MGPALAQAWIHPSETNSAPDIHVTAPTPVPATHTPLVSSNYRRHSYIPPSLIASAAAAVSPALKAESPPALPSGTHSASSISSKSFQRYAPQSQVVAYNSSKQTQQAAINAAPPSYDPNQPDILPPNGPYMPDSAGTPYQRAGYGNSQSLNDGFGAGRKGDIYGGGVESKERKDKRESSYKWMKKGVKGLGDLLS